jgi:hypothetical protein
MALMGIYWNNPFLRWSWFKQKKKFKKKVAGSQYFKDFWVPESILFGSVPVPD